MNKFDALIIGAGPSGSTIAYLLAKAGWSVAIVEKSEFPRRKVCGEYLSPTNFPLFDQLDFADLFFQNTGPEIQRVGLFANSLNLYSKMPRLKNASDEWGRALRREVLDTMLLTQASKIGAKVFQPSAVIELSKSNDIFISRIKSKTTQEIDEIESRLVISAHGSWEIGSLPTQAKRFPASPTDLIGLKAHFRNARLDPDLMPMIIFPGGYGGMVTCDAGYVSISCCIRQDYLKQIREKYSGQNIGETVEQHIFDTCEGVNNCLSVGNRSGEWLTAGVIRPGIRSRNMSGIFLVGNAAGESHPIIAEGISMAIQSSWLLAQCLIKRKPAYLNDSVLKEIYAEYDKLWLKTFRKRILAADLFARLAMSNISQKLMSPFMKTFPSILTFGARLSGKVNRIEI